MSSKTTNKNRLQFALPYRYKGTPITEPCYVEPYLGGIRAALIFRGDTASAVTLLGREIPNAYPVLEELAASELVEGLVLDGEFTTFDRHEVGAIIADQKRRDDAHKMTFNVYDIMAVDQWDRKVCETPLHYRKHALLMLLFRGGYRRTIYAPCSLAQTPEELARAKAAFLKHYDAVVYKDISSPYPFGSTVDWMVDRS